MGTYAVIAPGTTRVPQSVRNKEMKNFLPPETLVLAQHLAAHEAGAGTASVPMESPELRVYEKLRRHLCALTGVAGFQSLASRALTLAREEAPRLSAVKIIADGSIQGLGEAAPQTDKDDGGTILIAQLLGLLFIFIGEALTLRLVQDVWPDSGGEYELRR